MTIENQKMELISLISSDEFKLLVTQVTEKSTFDYIPQILTMEDHNKNPALDKISAIKTNYTDLRNKINEKQNDCINEIYIFKKKLKNNSLDE